MMIPRIIQRTPQFPMMDITRMTENTAVHISEEVVHGSGMELLLLIRTWIKVMSLNVFSYTEDALQVMLNSRFEVIVHAVMQYLVSKFIYFLVN